MVRATDGRRFIDGSRRAGLITAICATMVLSGAGEAFALDSLSVGSSANPQATVPMTISAHGSSTEPSTLRVFVQPGDECATGPGGAAANANLEAARSTATEVISLTVNGPFNYVASYTPPAAGSYKICAYMFRVSPTSSTSSQTASGFGVAAAPAAAGGGTGGPGAGESSDSTVANKSHCVVPPLKGRTYATARKRLHRAGCIVGKVTKPGRSHARPLRRGGRRRILKVVSLTPKPGAVRRARAPVALRLEYQTPRGPAK